MTTKLRLRNRRAAKTAAKAATRNADQGGTAVVVLAAISVCHMLNDVIQSLIMALYPMLKTALNLDFGQIGLITFTFQCTASLLQPFVGYYTDRNPTPYSLVLGMASSLIGLLLMSVATGYGMVLIAAGLIGMGSSVFHPESSRVARLASGGRHGMAQSVFQVGGNFGTALGPLAAAFIVLPFGQGSLAWFSIVALIAMILLAGIGSWYGKTIKLNDGKPMTESKAIAELSRGKVARTIAILMALTFSKQFYLVSITSFFTFYLIHTFGLSVKDAQLHLFIFLFAVAAGTVIGGPIGRPDRFAAGDLVVDFWRAAIHARAALRGSVLDRRAQRHYRRHSRVRLLFNSRLCTRSDSRARRNGRRTFLWTRIRRRRHWRRLFSAGSRT